MFIVAIVLTSRARSQMLRLTQTVKNPTPAVSDNFGLSVAISGSDALIGACIVARDGSADYREDRGCV